MKYNELLTYNESSVSYIGSIQINVSGIDSPIIISQPSIFFAETVDYNNATVIGLVTIDSVSSSQISITATQEQALAIADASVIYITPSANVSYEILNDQGFSTAEISIIASGSSSELSMENLTI